MEKEDLPVAMADREVWRQVVDFDPGSQGRQMMMMNESTRESTRACKSWRLTSMLVVFSLTLVRH